MSRLAVRLAAALAVLVVAWAGSRAFMRQAIYPAPPVRVGPPPAGYADVSWSAPDGATVHGWLGGAPAPRPLVVFFHGNGENLQTLEYSGIFERWRELDVGALAIDYPGYGRSGGRPSEESVVAAGQAAFDLAREAAPERPLVVAGWSLGAAVAARVASGRSGEVAGLALLSPWTSLADVARTHFPGPLVRLLLRERYDSLSAAAAIDSPTLVVHGARDAIIPAEQGRRLADALGLSARWIAIPDAGHNDLLARDVVWQHLDAFLSTLPH